MSKFNAEEFARAADRMRGKAKEEKRLLDNPSDEELMALMKKEPGVRKTVYGNLVAESEPTSRAAAFTKNSIDSPFDEEELGLLAQCEKALAKEKLICVDRIVGNARSETTVRLIIPERFAHIAFGGRNLFLPVKGEVKEPTYQIVFFSDGAFEANKQKPLPQKDITIRLAMLEDGRVIKIIRNSSYTGEYKKGVFASEDWVAKAKRGGIFLHAGCREDYLQSEKGDYRTTRSLFLALSANGKTTLTCKILARKEREKSWLIQDDGGFLMPDGSFHGFEGGGVYVKTERVNPGEQAEVYYGLLKPESVGENIYMTKDGDMDFYNFEKTSNGRAVIKRRDFMHAASYIDVPRIDNLVLITRGPIIPAISKLTLKDAVALMIDGRAMESSAGDPTQAGKIRSQFFYDPFIAGGRAEHANRFYEILKGLPHTSYYLMNTRGIGEGAHYMEINVGRTLAILDFLFRGGLDAKDWVDSPTGFKVPRAIDAVDEIYVHPERLYSKAEFESKQKELNKNRQESIEKIGSSLHPDIRKVLGA
ncbi:MAG: phosphoenolpyruvate carboxykinase (ATP) [Candidatus Micrarchaeota archaeon]|nr:phosphoenolpyruvate carboxykinase (ATP) [Candidatus Micrarchaeota archaeon]